MFDSAGKYFTLKKIVSILQNAGVPESQAYPRTKSNKYFSFNFLIINVKHGNYAKFKGINYIT